MNLFIRVSINSKPTLFSSCSTRNISSAVNFLSMSTSPMITLLAGRFSVRKIFSTVMTHRWQTMFLMSSFCGFRITDPD